MAVDFRCDKCGKLLRLEARPGQEVSCTHCGKKLTVPDALASLPRPQVPPSGRPAAPGSTPPPAPTAAPGEPEAEEYEEDQALTVLATVMPWAISILFHFGLALLFYFVTFMTLVDKDHEVADVVDSKPPPPPVVKKRPKHLGKNPLKKKTAQPTPTLKNTLRETPNPVGQGKTGPESLVIGAGASGGGWGGLGGSGLPGGGGGGEFLGTGFTADDVVFVIDKSGSMAAGAAFEILKNKLAESIGELSKDQNFHMVFFGDEKKPVEFGPSKLVPAEEEYKIEAAAFLEELVPQGQTLVLPALKRAFEALRKTDKDRIKVVFLLSDGSFEGFGGRHNAYKGLTGNKAVLAWLDDNNRKIATAEGEQREYKIYTFLYKGDDPDGKDVMRKIAKAHEGLYTHVGKDE